jgi:hypothetical protein
MCHKGFQVGRVFRRESRHVIGFLIKLKLKKDGKVIVYYIAQKQFVRHTVFLRKSFLYSIRTRFMLSAAPRLALATLPGAARQCMSAPCG